MAVEVPSAGHHRRLLKKGHSSLEIHKIVVRNPVELQISMSVGQRGINYGVMEG